MFWNHNRPGTIYCQTRLQQMSFISVKGSDYAILERPENFHKRLLELIASARERIMMTLLYLQDDAAGREVLEAVYAAKQRNPELYVRIYVDFHRAQRGLIGKGEQRGNSEMYYQMASTHDNPPAIYGVPVKRREIFGVMHLKGCVFDDTVLYSGASINDVYLNHDGRYRLDRYHEIKSHELADSLCAYVTSAFHINYAVQDFSQGPVHPAREIKDEIKELRRNLSGSQYSFPSSKIGSDAVGVCPVAGLGRRNNNLNRCVLWMLGAARHRLFICTPYFNPPKALMKALDQALQRGVEVTLVVGDKVANNFYIPEGEKFSPVGGVPYIYEQNLRTFMEKHRELIDSGRLKIRLWEDGRNTYHLKGLYLDDSYALITGNNLNPRAWKLDLENGIIVHDPNHLLQEKFVHEQQYILRHTKLLTSYTELQSLDDYPEHIRRLLNKVQRFKASIFIKQLL